MLCAALSCLLGWARAGLVACSAGVAHHGNVAPMLGSLRFCCLFICGCVCNSSSSWNLSLSIVCGQQTGSSQIELPGCVQCCSHQQACFGFVLVPLQWSFVALRCVCVRESVCVCMPQVCACPREMTVPLRLGSWIGWRHVRCCTLLLRPAAGCCCCSWCAVLLLVCVLNLILQAAGCVGSGINQR